MQLRLISKILWKGTDIGDEDIGDVYVIEWTLNSKMLLNHSIFAASYPYAFDKLVFFIPPGEPYTPLEKMILPFEFEVWIAIDVALLIGFVTIQIINCASEKIKNFGFGQTVKNPTMNMIDIILNGEQVKPQDAISHASFSYFSFFGAWSFAHATNQKILNSCNPI